MSENGSAQEFGRSHQAIIEAAPGTEDAALHERRTAITELGTALRTLAEQAATTEVSAAELRQVAAQLAAATAALGRRTRGRDTLPSADDLLGGIRMYNPVTGEGSPLAPPLRIEAVGGKVIGTCTLGLAFEGPPMFGHGGISALLLDQMLGYATSAANRPGMTVQLDTRYRAPVPLQTALRLEAAVTDVDGRKVTARGTIATAAEPDKVLVEAVGTFVALRPEQAVRLFGPVLGRDDDGPAVAHD